MKIKNLRFIIIFINNLSEHQNWNFNLKIMNKSELRINITNKNEKNKQKAYFVS